MSVRQYLNCLPANAESKHIQKHLTFSRLAEKIARIDSRLNELRAGWPSLCSSRLIDQAPKAESADKVSYKNSA